MRDLTAVHPMCFASIVACATGFSVFVEMINLRVRGSSSPVRLREPYQPATVREL